MGWPSNTCRTKSNNTANYIAGPSWKQHGIIDPKDHVSAMLHGSKFSALHEQQCDKFHRDGRPILDRRVPRQHREDHLAALGRQYGLQGRRSQQNLEIGTKGIEKNGSY